MRINFATPRRPILLLILTFAAGCASRSPRIDLERIRPGVDKARVLEAAGNPKRTYHAHGQDHWIYVFFEGERELFQQIDFRDGVVAKVHAVTSKASFTGRLENTDSMEDFERTVKEQQQKNSDFRDVPEDGKL